MLPAAARDLGLEPGLPVAVGAADTAAALRAAAPPAGAALLTLGTGGQWVAPGASLPGWGNTNLFLAVDGGMYRLAAALNVGATLTWVITVLGVCFDDLYSTAGRPWRADTPLFLPYSGSTTCARPATIRRASC
jgi:xylulokinase